MQCLWRKIQLTQVIRRCSTTLSSRKIFKYLLGFYLASFQDSFSNSIDLLLIFQPGDIGVIRVTFLSLALGMLSVWETSGDFHSSAFNMEVEAFW